MKATRAPNSRKQGIPWLTDIAACLLWGLVAGAYFRAAWQGGDYRDLGLCLFYGLIAGLMLFRRPAQRQGTWWETGLAWIAVFVPLIGLRPQGMGWAWAGLGLQTLGLIGLIAALLSLKRSLGIAPADRGLVTGGLYRYLRHPLYAAELLFNLGFCVSHASWRNLTVLGLVVVLQVIRILREERILTGYTSYAQRVPWRLLPGIW